MTSNHPIFAQLRSRLARVSRNSKKAVGDSVNAQSDFGKSKVFFSPSRHFHMMLMGSFAEHPGNGLVISVLRRAVVLRDRGNRIDITAFPFDTRFRRAARMVSKNYSLGDSIRFRNPYAEICGNDYREKLAKIDPLPGGEDWNIVADPSDKKVRRAYENGQYRQFIYSDAGSRVVFIDFLDESGRRLKRSWHDETGHLTKIEYFSSDNKPTSVEYVHIDGTVCLKADVKADGSESNFILALPDGTHENFSTVSDLETWWLVNFVFTELDWTPVISEYGFRARVFEQVAKVRKISVAYALHNLHLTFPYSYGSPIKSELVPFFDRISEYDAVVALSEEQRLDLVRTYNCSDNVFVIPHHFEGQNLTSEKKPRSAVMSARIVRTKGHFDAVRVWPRVLEEFPDAVLNIYGTGPDLESLRAEVLSAGLASSVLFHGFEKNVVAKVGEAEIYLAPSQFEGFPLSLIEAMSVGTVPVVYDFKYGARAMIEHGIDGFITERSNLDELSDSILYLMRNPDVMEQMSESAKGITRKFSSERLAREWTLLFDELERRYES